MYTSFSEKYEVRHQLIIIYAGLHSMQWLWQTALSVRVAVDVLIAATICFVLYTSRTKVKRYIANLCLHLYLALI